MNDTQEKVIFVASPTDVQDEREAVAKAIDTLNNTQNEFNFELKRWEDTYPAIGIDPQTEIIKQIGEWPKIDLFILILWHRFGTKTSDGRTGSLREYEEAYDSFLAHKTPKIMVYFCTADVPRSEIVKDDIGHIADFLKKPEINEKCLYKEYAVRKQFQDTVQDHILKHFKDEKKFSEQEEPDKTTDNNVDELFENIKAAKSNVQISTIETPLIMNSALSNQYDCNVYLKLENTQISGSFKIRGAIHAITEYSKMGHTNFVAASAGNHGLGVALAAANSSNVSTIFMPIETPITKVRAVEDYTKNIKLVGSNFDECKKMAQKFAIENDHKFVHPFDDQFVVAGQGTIGLELHDQWKGKNPPDYILIPFGGGGLFSGVGTVAKKVWPNTKLIAVEPSNIPSFSRAVYSDENDSWVTRPTIADGVAVEEIGEFTSLISMQLFDDIWLAREENIAEAISLLIDKGKIVVEGAAACTLGALIGKIAANKHELAGKNILLLMSGGNVDSMRVSNLLQRGLFLQRKLSHYRFEVEDRPGTLANITAAFRENNVNIIDLQHHPLGELLRVGMTYVDTVVETRGLRHSAELVRSLRSKGFRVSDIG